MRTFVFALLLLGCSAVPNSDISVQYKNEARKLGLNPVYPPREEFQIGDVYVWAWRKGSLYQEVTAYMGSENRFVHAANKFMADRIIFHETGTKGSGGKQTDLFGKRLNQRKQQSITSLPIVAFPSVSGDAGFSGGVGILKALQAIGIAGGARTQVTLDFNDVRTRWVPKVEAMKATGSDPVAALANLYRQNPQGYLRQILEQNYQRNKLHVSGKSMCEADLEFGVSVVRRVYLTRSISYTYRNGRIVSAGIKRATTGSTLSQVPAAPAVNVNISNSGELESNAAQLKALQSQIEALSKSQGEGDNVAFQTWDARGITFERKYDRLVSIGWDGFEFMDPQIDVLICPNLAFNKRYSNALSTYPSGRTTTPFTPFCASQSCAPITTGKSV